MQVRGGLALLASIGPVTLYFLALCIPNWHRPQVLPVVRGPSLFLSMLFRWPFGLKEHPGWRRLRRQRGRGSEFSYLFSCRASNLSADSQVTRYLLYRIAHLSSGLWEVGGFPTTQPT